MNLQNRHLDELVADYTGYLISVYQGCESATESPIEALMLWALMHVARHERFGMAHGNEIPEEIPDGYELYLIRQARIAQYRVDFAILYRGGCHDLKKIVVECDGHDFHERTKEQAERDRSKDRLIQDKGWKIYRFTGSEIFRSPLNCATSLLHSAWRE